MNLCQRPKTSSSFVFRLVLLVVSSCVSLRAQTTWHVSAAATPPGAGSATQPFVTVQDGINAAVPGDVVLVRPGVYFENIDFIGKDIAVRSSNGAGVTTIDGNAGFMCVRFVNGETSAASIRGFTLTNGSSIDGAGILCVGSSPVIEDCIIRNNVAVNDGGGIHAFNSSPVIRRCSITSNSSGFEGGGITSVVGSNVFLTDSVIATNSSGFGGGIAANGGSLNARDTFVESNSATGDGGGIGFFGSGSLVLDHCTIRSNVGVFGGGVIASGTTADIDGCVISGNSAVASGGGVGSFIGTLTLRNSIVAANQAAFLGGGVYSTSAMTTITNVTIRDNVAFNGGGVLVFNAPNLVVQNSILWGNVPDQVGASPGGAATIVTFSDIQGSFPGTGNISVDPLHVSPMNGDYRLTPTSPCIGAGSNGAAAGQLVDFEGNPRIVGSVVDMGGDEYAARLAGSGEDLSLTSTINGRFGDVALHPAAAGDLLALTMSSPFGSFDGLAPILVGEFFPVGTPPGGVPGFPSIHISIGGAQILFDGSMAGVFGPTLLTPTPITLLTTIPAGFGGFAGRVQTLVVTPFALNGFFAITDAHELRF